MIGNKTLLIKKKHSSKMSQALELFKYFCMSLKYVHKMLLLHRNISTTVHAMTKSFVSFYSAQDGESTDTSCLVFCANCENDKFLMKCQVYNKGIFTNFWYFVII